MAQLGMLVPAARARLEFVILDLYYIHIYPVTSSLSPVDAIITRMGAYDNMFSHASTFKVELDEWCCLLLTPQNTPDIFFSPSCKVLRDATPKSLVILDGMIYHAFKA